MATTYSAVRPAVAAGPEARYQSRRAPGAGRREQGAAHVPPAGQPPGQETAGQPESSNRGGPYGGNVAGTHDPYATRRNSALARPVPMARVA